MAPATPGKKFIRADDLRRVCRDMLVTHDVPDDDAAIIARCLVEADLRGVETHGVVRLPHYLNRVRLGLIKPRPAIAIDRVTPVAASVDGDNGFGFVVATRAMDEALAMAAEYGIGLASVRHSNHFGMAATYILKAIRAGHMAMVFTNASVSMPPWGGRRAAGSDEILVAGEPEARKEAARAVTGIELPDAEIAALRQEAESLGVSFPATSAIPYTA